jgi:hypothetical protein
MKEQVCSRVKMAVALFESYNWKNEDAGDTIPSTIQRVEVMLLPWFGVLASKTVTLQNGRNGRCCSIVQFSDSARPSLFSLLSLLPYQSPITLVQSSPRFHFGLDSSVFININTPASFTCFL